MVNWRDQFVNLYISLESWPKPDLQGAEKFHTARVHMPSFNEWNLQIINTRTFQHNQLCIAFADEQETAVLLFEQKQ